VFLYSLYCGEIFHAFISTLHAISALNNRDLVSLCREFLPWGIHNWFCVHIFCL